ncbi:MAG: hypothetical protein V4732_22020 [Pseudomonadota bacterium]
MDASNPKYKDAPQQVKSLSEALAKSHSKSGYSETITAEMLSTQKLSQNGEPVSLREHIIELADKAIKLNPSFAYPHVAKGRAFVRASMYENANTEIDLALAIDPTISAGIFLRADIFRRTKNITEAHKYYLQFINSNPNPQRKANAYYWIAKMHSDATYYCEEAERKSLLALARTAYEQNLKFSPDSAWGNVNFSIFLNGFEADFDNAERYAKRALDLMEFKMARYHLAAAQYQKIWRNMSQLSDSAINDEITKVALSTNISLTSAIEFETLGTLIRVRLSDLQLRTQGWKVKTELNH